MSERAFARARFYSVVVFVLYTMILHSFFNTLVLHHTTQFNNRSLSVLLPIYNLETHKTISCVFEIFSQRFSTVLPVYYLSFYVQIIARFSWCRQTYKWRLAANCSSNGTLYDDLYTDKVCLCVCASLILMLEMQFMAHHSAPFIPRAAEAAAASFHCT